MNKLITTATLLLLVPLLPVRAQEHQRVSPHETVSATIDGANIKIVYGRPYTKDPKTKEMRKIWGGLVPFGQVWRMGADEATTLTTDQDIAIGGTRIPAGSYSLFLQPEENGPAKLIVNKQTGQGGLDYDAKQDLGKVKMTMTKPPALVEQLTYTLASTGGNKGKLTLSWENVVASVNFTTK